MSALQIVTLYRPLLQIEDLSVWRCVLEYRPSAAVHVIAVHIVPVPIYLCCLLCCRRDSRAAGAQGRAEPAQTAPVDVSWLPV